MTDSLEIRLLGPFEVVASGGRIEIPGGKRQALLAMLALARGRAVPVDDLVDALWGADLPAAPRNAVQHHIARLRAALGHDSLGASGDGYVLHRAGVDAIRFEELVTAAAAALREGDPRAAAARAAAALELWRGRPLQGLVDAPWIAAETRRLEALRTDALEERFDAALGLGEHRELLAELRAAVDEHPYRERLWGQLMLAFYRSGRQADALDAYHEARRVLGEQLGLDPGPELRTLQEAILAHDPAIAALPMERVGRGNIPAPSTSFVGRDREVSDVTGLLAAHRIVTLIGPPGVGKTRIALEVAGRLEPNVSDGVWFVDLARATAPPDVERLLARAVDARGADGLEQVLGRLRGGDAVILFDSCEHLRGDVQRVVSTLLLSCPGVRVLATSRQALRVAGEARVTVTPLPLAARDDDGIGSPAVILFVERAQAARPGFALDAETAELVGAIVRSVDGLPLAIELAAARVNVLGVGELLALVDRRLALIRGQPESDAGAAIRTLVEWSYDLLHTDEKALLRQIAVHRGGASLASLIAARSGHGLDEATVTFLLEGLVDKSIVSVSFPGGAARYTILDTVREYACEQLRESGGEDAARGAHAAYFAELAEASRSGVRGSGWLTWMRRLELDNENFWAALHWAGESQDAETAIRLAAPLGWYFALAERVSEGRRFVELALTAATDAVPADLRVESLALLCYLATEELDLPGAAAAGELALSESAAGSPGRTLAGVALALAEARAGHPAQAAQLAEAARRNATAEGDEWGAAASCLVRAQGAAAAGDVDTVAVMSNELIRHAGAIDYDAFLLPGTLLQAWVADRLDHGPAAEEGYRRALVIAERCGLGDHAGFALAGLGSAACAAGDPLRGQQLLRQALAAADASHATWVAAHARVELAAALAMSDDTATADRLYRSVLDWSALPRPRTGRESLFVVLAPDPPAAALLGLAKLAEARGDARQAEDLRRRSGLTPASN